MQKQNWPWADLTEVLHLRLNHVQKQAAPTQEAMDEMESTVIQFKRVVI